MFFLITYVFTQRWEEKKLVIGVNGQTGAELRLALKKFCDANVNISYSVGRTDRTLKSVPDNFHKLFFLSSCYIQQCPVFH